MRVECQWNDKGKCNFMATTVVAYAFSGTEKQTIKTVRKLCTTHAGEVIAMLNEGNLCYETASLFEKAPKP